MDQQLQAHQDTEAMPTTGTGSKRYEHFVDIGNYVNKVRTMGPDKRVRLIRSVRARLFAGQRALKGLNDTPVLELSNGELYHIGTQALKYPNREATADDTKIDPQVFLPLILATFKPLQGKTEYSVNLHWSLPDPRLNNCGVELQQLLNGTHKFKLNGRDFKVRIKAHDPQFEGHALALEARETGAVADSGYTLLIDIGGGTWNILVVDEFGEVLDSISYTDRGGVYIAAQIAANQLFKDRLGFEPEIAPLMDAIASGQDHYPEHKDATFDDILENVVSVWYPQGMNVLKTRLASYLPLVTGFVYTGGNAELLRNYKTKAGTLLGDHPLVFIPKEPNLSNIKAMIQRQQQSVKN